MNLLHVLFVKIQIVNNGLGHTILLYVRPKRAIFLDVERYEFLKRLAK